VTSNEPRSLLAGGRGLYLILTAPVVPHIDLVRAACRRGVAAIQLREKALHDDDLLLLATELADLTRGYRTLFIVNDRPDIAAASGADGVHLGRSDEGIEAARAALGPDAIVGLSTRTPEEAAAALAAGADYIGVGPVFPTGTKPDALEPIGLSGMRAVAERVPDLPTVAIGGITSVTAAAVMGAGAQYVAVIAAVCHADDPIAAIDTFVEAGAGRAG
jgi:thiamine-phosphate diphosphorylase